MTRGIAPFALAFLLLISADCPKKIPPIARSLVTKMVTLLVTMATSRSEEEPMKHAPLLSARAIHFMAKDGLLAVGGRSGL